jgi:DNA-binding NtrC family response regulator
MASEPSQVDRPASLRDALDECRRDYCLQALQRTAGNVARAAREAGIGRQSLHRLIKRYDLTEKVRRKIRGNWGDFTD